MWAATLWDHNMLPLQWGVVIGTALAAAVCDLRTRRVPNLLTGPIVLAGLAWGIWVGGWAGLADSVAGCLLLAIPYVLLFVFAGGGAGDAKLMGAIGSRWLLQGYCWRSALPWPGSGSGAPWPTSGRSSTLCSCSWLRVAG